MGNPIDVRYQTAVENFQWPEVEEASNANQESHNIDSPVNIEIASAIVYANSLRATSPTRRLSLREVCYSVVQTADKILGKVETVTKIEAASDEQKINLKNRVKELSPAYPGVEKKDLKEIVLLFGIHVITNPEHNLPFYGPSYEDRSAEIKIFKGAIQALETRKTTPEFIANAPPELQTLLRNQLVQVEKMIEDQKVKLKNLERHQCTPEFTQLFLETIRTTVENKVLEKVG